ncbi:TetR/AcrR family transcriptional regulator [Changpingibacter yushuensis]|uniref:TetR/AcrR family transcriptional regulator n=1 Tax=Changpingibacter yushuensis TaxID=2758440 RepID=UPI00165E760E|nr:TetR/AcrR family transcriptional regulator [Changpingibacter yushuensis]
MALRGSYAKGIAKRDEITYKALEVIAEQGINGASIKELAAAVNLSQAGLLHYFASKEDLFIHILRARDTADVRRVVATLSEHDQHAVLSDPEVVEHGELAALRLAYLRLCHNDVNLALRAFLDLIEHNQKVPGLVELFSRMSTAAADPQSLAHEYFADRGNQVRQSFAEIFSELQRQGRIDPHADPQVLATVLQAISDGLQLQSLVDPDLNMVENVTGFLKAVIADFEAEVLNA